jgi:hypothetical protein
MTSLKPANNFFLKMAKLCKNLHVTTKRYHLPAEDFKKCISATKGISKETFIGGF